MKLKRRTWSIGSNYSQHNPLEPDAIDISDPPRRTACELFPITDNEDDGLKELNLRCDDSAGQKMIFVHAKLKRVK
jgi:hypothetical protein